MPTKLFVGSLSWNVTDDMLRDAFAAVGEVVSATVIRDRMTGRSKGFGFVEMASDADAQTAIEKINGQPIDGRNVVVNVARPKEDRPQGRSFGGGRPSFNRDRDNRGQW